MKTRMAGDAIRKLRKIEGQLKKSTKMHKEQAETIEGLIRASDTSTAAD